MRRVRVPSHLVRNSFFSLYHNASTEPHHHLNSAAVACALFPRHWAITLSTQRAKRRRPSRKPNPSSPVQPLLVNYSPTTRAHAREVASDENSSQRNQTTSSGRLSSRCWSTRNDSCDESACCGPPHLTEDTNGVINPMTPAGGYTNCGSSSYPSSTCVALDSVPPLRNIRAAHGDCPDVRRTNGNSEGGAGTSSHYPVRGPEEVTVAFNASDISAANIGICNVAETHCHVCTAAFVPGPREPSLDKWGVPSLLTCGSLRDALWQRLASRAAVLLPRYSPSGLLQLLALFRHAGAMPQSLLHGVARYLLEGEPYGPPAESFWRVWMANDLVLLCRLLSICSFNHEPLLQQIMSELCGRGHLLRASDIAVLVHAVHRLLCTSSVQYGGSAGDASIDAPNTCSSLECVAPESGSVHVMGLQPQRNQRQQPKWQHQKLQQLPQARAEWADQQKQGGQPHKKTQKKEAQHKGQQVVIEQWQALDLPSIQQREILKQMRCGEQQGGLGQPPQQQRQQRRGHGGQQQNSAIPDQRGKGWAGAVLRGYEASDESLKKVDSKNAGAIEKAFFSAKELQLFSRVAVIQLRSDPHITLRDGVTLLVGVLRLARVLEVVPSLELLASCVQLIERRCCCVSAAGVSARLLLRAIFALIEVERTALLRVQAFLSPPEVPATCLHDESQRKPLVAGGAGAAAGGNCDGNQALALLETARRVLPHLFAALSTRLEDVGPLKGLDVLNALHLLKEEEAAAARKCLLSASSPPFSLPQRMCSTWTSGCERPLDTPDFLDRGLSEEASEELHEQRKLPSSSASPHARGSATLQQSDEVYRGSVYPPCVLEEAARAKQHQEKPQQPWTERECDGDTSGPLINRILLSSRQKDHSFLLPDGAHCAAAVVSSKQARADDAHVPVQRLPSAAQVVAAPEGAAADQTSCAEHLRLCVAARLRRITRTDAVGFDILEGLLFHVSRFLHLLPVAHSLTFAVILKNFTLTQQLSVSDSSSSFCSQRVDSPNLPVAVSSSAAASTGASAAVAGDWEDNLSCYKHLTSCSPTACDAADLAVPAALADGVLSPDVSFTTKKEHNSTVLYKGEAKATALAEEGSRMDSRRHKREVAEMLREMLIENAQRNYRRWTHAEFQQLHTLLQ